MDHHMAIIESLDKDTETRRLSPVAIFGESQMNFTQIARVYKEPTFVSSKVMDT